MKTVLPGALIITMAWAPAVAGQQWISGTVVSKTGKPLANVWIVSPHRRGTHSDQEGSFVLANPGAVIYLEHSGYRPVVMVPESEQEKIDVVMEEETARKIPSCSESHGKRFAFGALSDLLFGTLGFQIPRGVKVKKAKDADYVQFVAFPKSRTDKSAIVGWSGPTATSGFPPDDWIAGSTEIQAKALSNGVIDLLDVRGRSRDGTRWRSIGISTFSVSYENASPESSNLFDKIIDSACFHRDTYWDDNPNGQTARK